MQTIPGNAAIWYRFEYAGDGSEIVLRMVNGLTSGLGFNVFVPEQAVDWWNTGPIGRGTGTPCGVNAISNPNLNCGENVNDLLWSGRFPTPGTYFVQVENPTPGPIEFLLTVSGTGINVCGPGGLGQGTGDPNFLPCPNSVQP
jgi:hypothetical protein